MRNRREKTLLNSYHRFIVNVFLNWVEKKWKTFKTSSKQMAATFKRSNFSDFILSKDEMGLFFTRRLFWDNSIESILIVCDQFLTLGAVISWLSPADLSAPCGLLHRAVESGPGRLLFPTKPRWVWTQTGSGVILLMFTCICVSLHHSKVKCTWFRITYFINPLFGRHVEM